MENSKQIYECLPLYKAAISDDWEAARCFFDKTGMVLDVRITRDLETCLHVAVGTNSSHRFVEELVERITREDPQMLKTASRNEDTALHYAASVGNTEAAKLLVSKDSEMTQITNGDMYTPLKLAVWAGCEETLYFLLQKTKDLVGEDGTSPYRGVHGSDLLTDAITTEFYDVALYLVNKYPDLVMEKNKDSWTGFQILATKPKAFLSGTKLGSWQKVIYKWIPVNLKKALQSDRKPNQNLTKGSCGMLRYLAPQIKRLHDKKVKHIQAEELVQQMCNIIMKKADHGIIWEAFGTALSPAIKYGIQEFVEQCFQHYPGLIWYDVRGFFVLTAIRERQEKVYNLVYQISGHKAFAAQKCVNGENALHVAGKLAPPHRLNKVTGAALQMQRELQWFKEIKNFVPPAYQKDFNKRRKTPRMVFTSEHKQLLKDAQQWMKDTSSSATVVAALIVTMAFAGMFTIPGGNNDNGKPLFLNDGVFILFATSDAVALFFSATSVLMFLSILSSRFAEKDFLYSLPKRLMFGLISLFISLAATMVAFSATLSLVLRDKIQWIAAPVILLASVPVTLFMFLQYPLLIELVCSTYGKGIFYKQNNELLH